MGKYASRAQRGKFHAMEKRGEISRAEVAKRDRASKGLKLPSYASTGSRRRPRKSVGY